MRRISPCRCRLPLVEAATRLGLFYDNLFKQEKIAFGEWVLPKKLSGGEVHKALLDAYGAVQQLHPFRVEQYRHDFDLIVPRLQKPGVGEGLYRAAQRVSERAGGLDFTRQDRQKAYAFREKVPGFMPF